MKFSTLIVQVLHYTGHGAKSYLAFEDDSGGTHRVNAITLKDLVTAGDGKVNFFRCVSKVINYKIKINVV